jgi:cyclase
MIKHDEQVSRIAGGATMKRIMTAATKISFAVLLVLASNATSVSAQAPPPAAAAAAPRDYSKVEIKITKLGENFYELDGDGGTMGFLAGPDGVFVVDSQRAQLVDKIAAAIKQVTPAPIRFLVDTHVHADHTGGNENFIKMGVMLISRDEVRTRLADGTVPGIPPVAPTALPQITYEGRMTFHMDGEDVELIPVPHAHTDGDTIVRFPKNNVIMCGDFYRSAGYPNIDRVSGGSLNGMIEGLNYLASLAGPQTKIVPGHGSLVIGSEAILAQRSMLMDMRDRVAKLIQQGKSEKEVIAAHPTADYDAKVPQGAQTADRFVTQLYGELKPATGGQ